MRMEGRAYELGWNVRGALLYGGLAMRRDAAAGSGEGMPSSSSSSPTEEEEERRNDEAEDSHHHHHHPPPRGYDDYHGRPGSYKTGLIALPNAIMDELGPSRVHLSWRLTNVERGANNDDDDGGGGYYVATFDNDGTHRKVKACTLVVTIPTYAIGTSLDVVLPGSADLFRRGKSDDAKISEGVSYPPVASVTVAYPKSAFRDVDLADGSGNLRDLPGFGMVSTRSAGLRILATLFSSSLFPGRCPVEYNLLSYTIGGARDEAVGAMSEDDLVAVVDGDLRTMLLRPEAPHPKVLGLKIWPRTIPQYELGHSDTMTELKRMEDANDAGGLWVCGNYRTGVSLTACINFGYDQAKVVAGHLSSKRRG
ncbi:hypothetical protein ACHAXA_004015 [Cyclostephanos tholiformis]|uniref:Protoporphyrinogen oxidase n=1 Tax=Cyclostephanos tholiformis TaxID=382380 RepID=A0ABD3S085_9STRA